jgi:hypothetical protein
MAYEESKDTKPDAEVVVPASEETATKKVKLDLEVDTSVKDLGPNPYAKIIHMAKAVDAWRIFPRLFLTVYIILLYKTVIWYMGLEDPSMEQSVLWLEQARHGLDCIPAPVKNNPLVTLTDHHYIVYYEHGSLQHSWR